MTKLITPREAGHPRDILLTPDLADMMLLSNHHPKTQVIGIELTPQILRPDIQAALERAKTHGWVTLIDVGPVPQQPGIFRQFKMTEAGFTRLAILKLKTSTPEGGPAAN